MVKAARGRPKAKLSDDERSVKTSVDVTRKALNILNEYAGKYGKRGPRVTILSSMIEVFAALPTPIKDLLAGRLDEEDRRPCAIRLREWAEQIEQPEVTQAAGIIGGKAPKTKEPDDRNIR